MKIDPRSQSLKDIYKLMIDIIVPRPIAFVSTVSREGNLNLAPFSYFNGVSSQPPMIMISVGRKSDGKKKDTFRNIEETGEFVVNVVTESIAEAMNIAATDFPDGMSEFEQANLTPFPSDLVRPPRVAESPVNLECRLVQVIELGDPPNALIVGEIVRFHVADGLIERGRVDPRKLKPVGRLGGAQYCRVTDIFEMKRHRYQDPTASAGSV